MSFAKTLMINFLLFLVFILVRMSYQNKLKSNLSLTSTSTTSSTEFIRKTSDYMRNEGRQEIVVKGFEMLKETKLKELKNINTKNNSFKQ